MISKPKDKFPRFFLVLSNIFSWENILAFLAALMLIAIYIVTAADAPTWLYQGF